MGDTELEAAARALQGWLIAWASTPDRGPDRPLPDGLFDHLKAISAAVDALPSPPEPLKVGDTVTRKDADRVPVGAILRDSGGHAWEVWTQGAVWACAGGERCTLDGLKWLPMTVLWLPEPSDA